MKFEIGCRSYPTKMAAKKEIQRVIHSAELNRPLEGEDFALIKDLLDLHPNRESKLLGGCKNITVEIYHPPPPLARQRCFWIIHDDGSKIDFSFHKCLNRKDDRLQDAARWVIADTVHSYKRKYFEDKEIVLCEATGKRLSWKEASVDHSGLWPFSKILREWIAQRESPPRILDLGTRYAFDEFVSADFLAYHNDRAVLKVVCKKYNSSKGARIKAG